MWETTYSIGLMDGDRFVDIAEGLSKDPLVVAKSYAQWVQSDWIVMEGSNAPTVQIALPKI